MDKGDNILVVDPGLVEVVTLTEDNGRDMQDGQGNEVATRGSSLAPNPAGSQAMITPMSNVNSLGLSSEGDTDNVGGLPLPSPLGDNANISSNGDGPGADMVAQQELTSEDSFCDPSKPPSNLSLPPNFTWVFLDGVWTLVPTKFSSELTTKSNHAVGEVFKDNLEIWSGENQDDGLVHETSGGLEEIGAE